MENLSSRRATCPSPALPLLATRPAPCCVAFPAVLLSRKHPHVGGSSRHAFHAHQLLPVSLASEYIHSNCGALGGSPPGAPQNSSPSRSLRRTRALRRVQDDAMLDDLAEAVLGVAEEVALEAGLVIRNKLGKAEEVSSKEVRCDLVTEVDRECELLITKRVQACFPLHRILGEETATEEKMAVLGEGALGDTDWVWIIDPIDGTLNFVGGIPMCAVSVGVARGAHVEVGAVYNPFSNELFSGRRGEGAYLNGKPLPGPDSVPELELEDAAVAVGLPSLQADRARLLESMAAVAPHARTMRAFGSAALHMSYVAAGRLGCFFEPALKPWDIAAARLLVEEVGGTVTTMEGTELPLAGGSVVASRGGSTFHERILSLIQ